MFHGHRSVVQQCCVRLHSTSNKVAPANKKSTWRRDGKRERGINRGIKGRKKAAGDGKDRGRARRWMEPKIGQVIDLLEEKDCLWDVNKKDYHVRNKELSKRSKTFWTLTLLKSRRRLLVCVLNLAEDPTCSDLLRGFAHIG